MQNTRIRENAMASGESASSGIVFLELLPEIRNHIYKCLLVEDEQICLTARRRYREDELGRSLGKPDRNNVRVARDEVIYSDDRRCHNHSGHRSVPPSRANISSTCRQVYEEAMPILYGNNQFSFPRAWDLSEFLGLVGQQAQHIRCVRIRSGGLHRDKPRLVLKKLCVAKSLRKLYIDHTDICVRHERSGKLDTIIKDCAGLVQFLHDSYRRQSLNLNALDAIALHLETHARHMEEASESAPLSYPYRTKGVACVKCKCLCRDVKQRHAVLQAKFREGMEKALKRLISREERIKKNIETAVSDGCLDPRLMAVSS